jgi:hypothetical protein
MRALHALSGCVHALLLLLLLLQDRATLVKLAPSLLSAQQQGRQRFKFVALLWQDQQQQQQPGSKTTTSNSSSNGTSSSSSGTADYDQAVSQLASAGVSVLGYDAVLGAGQQLRVLGPFQPAACSRGSLATLVYTSGTTGEFLWFTFTFGGGMEAGV